MIHWPCCTTASNYVQSHHVRSGVAVEGSQVCSSEVQHATEHIAYCQRTYQVLCLFIAG